MSEFDSIRPYRDDEVQAVLARLTADRGFLSVLGRFLLPRALWRLEPPLRPLLARVLRRQTDGLADVTEFQLTLEPYFHRLLTRTVAALEIEGIEALDATRAHLFVGNHRDIAMDPAILNYALFVNAVPTTRIAIGSNLLKRPFATDLMRLNKAFIVDREAEGVKGMARAVKQTSGFIHHSLAEGASVWIAQREGRAKDSWDRTDPAILKMFAFARRKSGETLAQILNGMRITPVTVAYEWDPCDTQKAAVLEAVDRAGGYEKSGDEDMISIARGVTGQKGRIAVNVGAPMDFAPDCDAEAAALELDRAIVGAYRLFPSNLLAWADTADAASQAAPAAAFARSALAAVPDSARAAYAVRLAACPEALRPYWLKIYANPVRNRIALAD